MSDRNKNRGENQEETGGTAALGATQPEEWEIRLKEALMKKFEAESGK